MYTKRLHARNVNGNLNRWDRATRIAGGFGLIAAVMFTEASPLGWWMVLPLLAVYPVLTGGMGNDPLLDLLRIQRMQRRPGSQFFTEATA
jgi:hypothetical protein